MPKRMADGMNDVRAIRLSEIVEDFRKLQHYIAQIQTAPTEEEYYGPGYVILRQCAADGQSSLREPFAASASSPNGDSEKEKRQLQQVILDASSRRLQAQKIYLRATAAMRWINTRNAILESSGANAKALQDVDNRLQSELAAITDRRVLDELRTEDQMSGKWIEEDPSLPSVQSWIASRR